MSKSHMLATQWSTIPLTDPAKYIITKIEIELSVK